MSRDKITFTTDHIILCNSIETGSSSGHKLPFSQDSNYKIKCTAIAEQSNSGMIDLDADGVLTASEFYEDGFKYTNAPIITKSGNYLYVNNPNDFAVIFFYQHNHQDYADEEFSVNVSANSSTRLTDINLANYTAGITIRGYLRPSDYTSQFDMSKTISYSYPDFAGFVPEWEYSPTRGFVLANRVAFNNLLSNIGVSAANVSIGVVVKHNHHKGSGTKRTRYTWRDAQNSNDPNFLHTGLSTEEFMSPLRYNQSTGAIGNTTLSLLGNIGMSTRDSSYFDCIRGRVDRNRSLAYMFVSIKFSYMNSNREWIRTQDSKTWLQVGAGTSRIVPEPVYHSDN